MWGILGVLQLNFAVKILLWVEGKNRLKYSETLIFIVSYTKYFLKYLNFHRKINILNRIPYIYIKNSLKYNL